jgi:hypothetical protein
VLDKMNGVNHSACPALFYFVTSKIRGVSIEKL